MVNVANDLENSSVHEFYSLMYTLNSDGSSKESPRHTRACQLEPRDEAEWRKFQKLPYALIKSRSYLASSIYIYILSTCCRVRIDAYLHSG